MGTKISTSVLAKSVHLPCILHWNNKHFVVCYKIKHNIKKIWKTNKDKDDHNYIFYISDPALGLYTLNTKDFENCWLNHDGNNHCGIALVMWTTPSFFRTKEEKEEEISIRYFAKYLYPYKAEIIQLLASMGVVSIIQLLFPFLTQSIVDNGIGENNISLITLILIAQFILYTTQMCVEFLRNWLSLHTTTRINISLISDFLMKLMRLPISFFDSRMIGDIMQRIGDHRRIQSFLTGSSINLIFSVGNFFVFAFILLFYNTIVFFVFLLGNIIYIIWVVCFMRYRRKLDNQRFAQSAEDQSNLVELITGMQEIKLANSEKIKRWKWEKIQARLFKTSLDSLSIGQSQQIGSMFFSQSTNLIISYIAARAVIDGNMTLGMMMSLSYIIGQLSLPIGQFVNFIQSFQDAKISLERLGEVHNRKNEENDYIARLNELPYKLDINLVDVSFGYDKSMENLILHNISINIPAGTTTAIVGPSGCGKTTLLKLLMGFYQPQRGKITIGNTPLDSISKKIWRDNIGVVMQDGFIFSDTIVGNIAVGKENIDWTLLYECAKAANIREYIEAQPMTYHTKIGMEGKGLSQGQKQRILIARALYKQPRYLFFDEATSSLDATNESQIIENIETYKRDKTVLIVAHRLSTIKNADNIIVMEKGRIVEQGSHNDLLSKKGHYFTLLKNQLS